jgi:hypothetical protein
LSVFDGFQTLEIDNGIVLPPSGEIIVVWAKAIFARSEDGGDTFDKPINVSNNEKYALVESHIAASAACLIEFKICAHEP